MLWLSLSILRGALQGVGDYQGVGLSLVGEQAVRLVTGRSWPRGLGVTGAYLGTPLSFLAMSGYCAWRLARRSEAGGAARSRHEAAAALGLGRTSSGPGHRSPDWP